MSRVIEQRANSEGFPKAGELVEIQPMQELTYRDRLTFNVLIENAGPRIAEDCWHEIALQKLRGLRYKSNERVSDSIDRLMTVTVKIPAKDPNGLDAILTTVLIAENLQTIDENDSRAMLRYKFTETMRRVISNSRYWARLKAYVMFAFSSKYALALYESVCLRINLQVESQVFWVKDFRILLDIRDGKLSAFKSLKQWALEPAVLEVNALSDFVVDVEPLREGGRERGKLNGFRLSWRRKTKEEWQATLDELMRAKTGRKSRITGTVEEVVF